VKVNPSFILPFTKGEERGGVLIMTKHYNKKSKQEKPHPQSLSLLRRGKKGEVNY
jgi:hypothetical protein